MGSEVLASTVLGILCVLLQDAFVCVPLHIRAHHRPEFLIDLVLGFIEDQVEQPEGRALGCRARMSERALTFASLPQRCLLP